jgi:hypothetical protein
MKEPVELPSSKTIIDYITISMNLMLLTKYFIEKHLINDPCDPFNRSPLTLE